MYLKGNFDGTLTPLKAVCEQLIWLKIVLWRLWDLVYDEEVSKAFTKEDTEVDNDDELEPEVDAQLGQSKNYITPKGAQKLRAELNQLFDVDRPTLVKTVSWAASNGDRSENGDYIYGKRKLREIDRRIRFLSKRLDKSEIIAPSSRKGVDQVLFGATVDVENEQGKRLVYRIVGIDETDVAAGHVSWISPIAKALLNAKVGDVVTFRAPKGEEELEIVQIRYEDF